MVENKVTLGYWGVRGYGQLARYTLEAAGAQYEEVRYSDPTEWFQTVKPNLKNPLPNIPYIIDGDIVITEHDAVVRYAARKFRPDLLGNSDAEYGMVENIFCFFAKLRAKLTEFCIRPVDTVEGRAEFINGLASQLQKLDAHVEGKSFFVGDHLTIADIYFYEDFAIMKLISEAAATTTFKNLAHISSEFEN